jgi:hypothetical protein
VTSLAVRALPSAPTDAGGAHLEVRSTYTGAAGGQRSAPGSAVLWKTIQRADRGSKQTAWLSAGAPKASWNSEENWAVRRRSSDYGPHEAA